MVSIGSKFGVLFSVTAAVFASHAAGRNMNQAWSTRLPIEPNSVSAQPGGVWVAGASARRSGRGSALFFTARKKKLSRRFSAGGFPSSIVGGGTSVWVANGRGAVGSSGRGENTVWHVSFVKRKIQIKKFAVQNPAALARQSTWVWILTGGGGRTTIERVGANSRRVSAPRAVKGTTFRPSLAAGPEAACTITSVPASGPPQSILVCISADQLRSIKPLRLPGVAGGIAFGKKAFWVTTTVASADGASKGELLRIDLGDRKIRLFTTLPAAGRVVYSDNRLWIVTGHGVVTPVDAETGHSGNPVLVGGAVDDLAVSRAGIWTIDHYGHRLSYAPR